MLLTGTRRMPGWLAAIHRPWASAASSLLPRTNGRTWCGGSSSTWWPIAVRVRAQWCAALHASITTRAGWRWAKNSMNLARVSLRREISPVAGFTQCSWKTVLAVSTA